VDSLFEPVSDYYTEDVQAVRHEVERNVSEVIACRSPDLSDIRKLDGDKLTSRGMFGRLGRPDGDDRVQLTGPHAVDKTGCSYSANRVWVSVLPDVTE
jgi:hypothetical protein